MMYVNIWRHLKKNANDDNDNDNEKWWMDKTEKTKLTSKSRIASDHQNKFFIFIFIFNFHKVIINKQEKENIGGKIILRYKSLW